MTLICLRKEKTKFLDNLKMLLVFLIFIFSLYFGGELKAGAIYGIKLSLFNIIPTLFPFFILADIWNSTLYVSDENLIARGFGRLLNISNEGLNVFLIGSLCGFPLGAKATACKYNDELLSKREVEQLTSTCNNPSAAFVISGIGAGLLGSIKTGILLYLSVLISAIIVGYIFKGKKKNVTFSGLKARQRFDLIKSISDAGLTRISVSSYVIFFSAIIGLSKSLIKNKVALTIISALLELGSASSIIQENASLLGPAFLPLLSFALSFSGLSVFFQVFSILPTFVSKKNYLLIKLLQGLISATITHLFYIII